MSKKCIACDHPMPDVSDSPKCPECLMAANETGFGKDNDEVPFVVVGTIKDVNAFFNDEGVWLGYQDK